MLSPEDEDECRGAACCAPTTTPCEESGGEAVALRTPTTFWIWSSRLSTVASSASISHDNRQTPGGPCESTANPRIGRLRRRRAPHAPPNVRSPLLLCTVTARERFIPAPPRAA